MNLMLHCGARHVSWDELRKVNTPAPTRTHRPVPHHDLNNMVKRVMEENGLKVTEAQHGIMQVNRGGIGTRCEQEGDHGPAMGVVP